MSHYTQPCTCKTKHCEHYRSDFEEYLEKNKPNSEKVFKFFNNFIKKAGGKKEIRKKLYE